MFENVKSVPLVVDKVAQLICSLPVTVKVGAPTTAVAAERAKVTVGGVVSVAVTVIDWGEPGKVVWALPAVSVIEKPPAAVKVDVTAAPPLTAVEVAVIVQTVVLVCTMPVIAEIFAVNVKSVPEAVDKVVQSIASLPVMVKVIA